MKPSRILAIVVAAVVWAVFAIFGLSPTSCIAQEESEKLLEPLPPVPESQILDDGRVFSKSEFDELSAYLKDIRARHGIEIYLAVFSFCGTESVEERAHRLRAEWANKNTGVVVVYERGSSGLSFVATDEIDALMTRFDINRILEQAGREAQRESGANKQIRVAVHTLASSLVESIERRHAVNTLVGEKRQILIAATFAAILLSALIGLVIARFVRKADRRADEFYYFPPTTVGMRYGGPYTGGAHAELRFVKT